MIPSSLKIISGGQTGVDRAALDAAMALNLSYGGAVPKGRKAEDGPIHRKYAFLRELPTERYDVRTERNVCDGDATLILTIGKPKGGTAYTAACARMQGKPHLLVDLGEKTDEEIVERVKDWLAQTRPTILNVAGPRASQAPGIYDRAYRLLHRILQPSFRSGEFEEHHT